jgi:hypothetical protein
MDLVFRFSRENSMIACGELELVILCRMQIIFCKSRNDGIGIEQCVCISNKWFSFVLYPLLNESAFCT